MIRIPIDVLYKPYTAVPTPSFNRMKVELKQLRNALRAISDQGYESFMNTTEELLGRIDFDVEMAQWALGERDERPEI